jgi:hypothetical protein
LYPEVKVSGYTFTGIIGSEMLLGVVKAVMYWQIRYGMITTWKVAGSIPHGVVGIFH